MLVGKKVSFLLSLVFLAYLSGLLASPVNGVPPEEIFYDDGEAGWLTWTVGSPYGYAVKFTPPRTPWTLSLIKLQGYRMGSNNFYVEIWDENRNELFHETYIYRDYFREWDCLTWVLIDVPDLTINGDFYVCIFPNYVKDAHALYLGADSSEPIDNRSYEVRMDTNTITWSYTSRDWMIRAVGFPAATLDNILYIFTPNNFAYVIGSTDPHGPYGWGAHTIDVVGASCAAHKLGEYMMTGPPISYLDTDIATYVPGTDEITFHPTVYNNLIGFGGPGVNMLFYFYNEGLAARFSSTNGWHIEVPSTAHTYWMQTDPSGRVTIDYAVTALQYDSTLKRYVMLAAGITKYGSLASSKVLSEFERYGLNGRAVVIRVSDGNGDGYLTSKAIIEGFEAIEIIETIP